MTRRIPAPLKTIVPGSDVDIEGEGEILNIAAEPTERRAYVRDRQDAIG